MRNGDRNPNAKLNWNLVKEIRNDYFILGVSVSYLSDCWGVSRSNIRDIINFKTWREDVSADDRRISL